MRTPRIDIRIRLAPLLFVALIASAAPAADADRIAVVVRAPAADLPDLVSPEGRSRWELGALSEIGRDRVSWSADGAAVIRSGTTSLVRFVDPSGGDAAIRWSFPERDRTALRPGFENALELDRVAGPTTDRLRVSTTIAGIGWVVLPSGPREVVLQRAEVRVDGDRGWIEHRWIDPRAGVVATVRRDLESPGTILDIGYVDEVLAGAAELVIYADEVDVASFTSVLYGRDVPNATVQDLTPEQYATIGDLIAADAWNFSQNTSGTEIASTVVDLVAAETCNRDDDAVPATAQCGFGGQGRQLGRQDIDFEGVDPTKNNQVLEREDRVADVTVWLRAGAQKEGRTGLFGGGESRFCYDEGRTPVPLWRFAHEDAAGFFMQPGDFWGPEWADPVNTPFFDCEQTLFNQVCGDDQLFPILYAKPCNDHQGTQTGEVLKGGVVTLPSGHTLNALLVRTVGDFCVYSASSCRDGLFGNKLDEARTVVYLWQVPYIGTVVLLQSEQDAPDLTSWSVLDITDIRFGLFPPLSITASNPTDTTIDVSWDPGPDAGRIDGYRVYWDVDSGSTSAYAGSVDVLGAANTSTTLTGLEPGTTYYITVTSLSDHANPSRPTNVTTYESLLFPTQVSGDPDLVYPVEVQATTTGGTCTPSEEIANVVVDKTAVLGEVEICWQASTDACIDGYRVLGASTPESDAGFSPLADVSGATCWTGDPGASSYFLVVGTGPGGEGPWGHYGR